MADLADLLEHTSRTFALTIPLLPEPTATEVTLAYLLFRIADTFEDAAAWPRARRLQALDHFAVLLREPQISSAAEHARLLAVHWLTAPTLTDHLGYRSLIAETPAVLLALDAIERPRREAIVAHTLRTVVGMAGYVRRSTDTGQLTLTSLDDLREYCYVVAGIVGELLTELFTRTHPALGEGTHGELLRTHARAFGEGLQLVNILKDSADDARDGRVYLPGDVPREEVFELARVDLAAAGTYVNALSDARAPRGYVAFTALPVLLARASLAALEARGPGAKVSRSEVLAITAGLHARLDAGESPLGDGQVSQGPSAQC